MVCWRLFPWNPNKKVQRKEYAYLNFVTFASMSARFTALTFLLIAYAVLLGHNVIPHHHCVSEHEVADHHSCPSHDDHHHDSEPEPTFCHFLNWDSNFTTSTQNNNISIQKTQDHPVPAVCEYLQYNFPCVVHVFYTTGEDPPGLRCKGSCSGLRAPPIL
jgi:hypothetical protein